MNGYELKQKVQSRRHSLRHYDKREPESTLDFADVGLWTGLRDHRQ